MPCPVREDVVTESREKLVVINPLGLHARPAAKLVKTVLRFRCEVFVAYNGQRVNGKSIMGLLTLAAGQGSCLEVVCTGEDAEAAMAEVRALFASGFGE
ncbi:MAG TPA: HPr family phosphocarrier protein [Candidatus Hydrogenedentes bacterium]|nr:HPr family phosphocarrier protein [Candidatus Hydrogenedentota bacterium]HPG69820.1 HPr family phosphocarrier protein [Candidatus Hydrogenedentota bacterium]